MQMQKSRPKNKTKVTRKKDEQTYESLLSTLPQDTLPAYPQLDILPTLQSLEASAPTLTADPLVVEPSAPPLQEPLFQERAPTLKPLPLQTLESLCPLSTKHSAWVKEFQQTMSILSHPNANPEKEDDFFYARLRDYECFYAAHQGLKLQAQSLQKSLSNTVARLWSLQTKTEKLEAKCGDGIVLAHHYTIETANWEDAVEKEVLSILAAQRDLGKPVETLFRMKLSKFWIQNYLDQWMAQSLLFSHSSILNTHQHQLQERERIHYLLHVLFFFEKRHFRPLEQEADVFVKDVRGWIMQLGSGFLPFVYIKDARLLLLHSLRCPGIGVW